jgi:hypothetical protein
MERKPGGGAFWLNHDWKSITNGADLVASVLMLEAKENTVTQQSPSYGARPNTQESISEKVADKTSELADQALDRADEWLEPTGLSLRERPMTVLAVVAGLAFAAGAFWMLKNSRSQSRYDQWLETLSELPRRAGWR